MSLENEKNKKEQYDGVHLSVFLSMSIFCDYFNLPDVIFPVLFLLYFTFSFYFLEKWAKGKIIKYATFYLILFIIGKIVERLF